MADQLLEACKIARDALIELSNNPAFEDDAPEFNEGGTSYTACTFLQIAIRDAQEGCGI